VGATMTNPKTIERVGVLLVHGIGEQRRFAHLETEVRDLARAIQRLHDDDRTVVSVRATEEAEYVAERESWQAGCVAPLTIDVRRGEDMTRIEFREVWWADLDEPTTWRSSFKFWAWGLSIWAARQKSRAQSWRMKNGQRVGAPLNTLANLMMAPGPKANGVSPMLSLGDRRHLFIVGVAFILIVSTLSVLSWILRKIGVVPRVPFIDLLVSYLSDVKLYGVDGSTGAGHVIDMHQPRRVTIRRRMVCALAQMALGEYDRWYVLAHSLGTVVAHNGLNETAHALPNYLDEALWNRLVQNGFCGIAGVGQIGTEIVAMMPQRPAWLDDKDMIVREKLFSGLRGFLTYGSPLDKFATLFPKIVAMNLDAAVFPKANGRYPDCEWINVFDPTDPVSANLDFFNIPTVIAMSPHHVSLSPVNLGFCAFPVLLWSHIRYLSVGKLFSGEDLPEGRLVDRVAEWLVLGQKFSRPVFDGDWMAPAGPRVAARQSSMMTQLVALMVVAAAILAAGLGPLVRGIASLWHPAERLLDHAYAYVGELPLVGIAIDPNVPVWCSFALQTVFFIAAAACLVAAAGIVARFSRT